VADPAPALEFIEWSIARSAFFAWIRIFFAEGLVGFAPFGSVAEREASWDTELAESPLCSLSFVGAAIDESLRVTTVSSAPSSPDAEGLDGVCLAKTSVSFYFPRV
jgi:hypothetical protein